MIYLEVLPAFIIYLVAFSVATSLARFTQAGQPFFPYLWRAFIASTCTVIGANAVVWAIVATVGIVLTIMDPTDQTHNTITLPSALESLLHPIPASIVGAIVGIACGVAWGILATRRLDLQTSKPKVAA